jgi:AcrR family transcriptional regulator
MDSLSVREKNKQRVTQRIVAAAVALFKTKGCSQTTMDDIAVKAGISRATLFNYFPSKDNLLLPWGQEILERYIQPGMAAYLQAQPSTILALQFLFTTLSENILVSPDVIRAFVREALRPNNRAQTGLARTGMRELFIDVLTYGQERGEVRRDIPLDEMAVYLGALHSCLLFRLLEPGAPSETRSDMDRLLAFLEAGLAPGPGQK